ncbi:hypothetical protein TNCT_336981 [Trichonephila clavata]|uniref:Uncharacterized protein n=1 Tax=Trichonephila clavata TaxID=2740835 RepID=A0A8X6FBX5_TRICU|nr:hypothetical protein TNCT_336981 [Trichonephila clavata]
MIQDSYFLIFKISTGKCSKYGKGGILISPWESQYLPDPPYPSDRRKKRQLQQPIVDHIGEFCIEITRDDNELKSPLSFLPASDLTLKIHTSRRKVLAPHFLFLHSSVAGFKRSSVCSRKENRASSSQ